MCIRDRCYTRANAEVVTSDEFLDLEIEKGCMFSWYFHFMPTGNGASPELMPTPEPVSYTHLLPWTMARSFPTVRAWKPLYLRQAASVPKCITVTHIAAAKEEAMKSKTR